jgi:hypothetical protein
MPSRTRRRWIIGVVLTLTAIAAAVAVVVNAHTPRPPEFLCWDAPATGSAAKYVVTYDGGAPVETTRDCMRLPATLQDGEHSAVIRAVDAYGQVSPPASIKFVVP